ncbi:hypothetical protein PZE06_20960 [Robertmurraya sp. DFI.2.37]|uniref:hypothetical protein n=1 Tax=Robertmurraya sp. DFI.2.37 TaxID=3031819 RepID=UPI001245AE12|nr:hypothetical protein [Robertmurraya sp. DFI.2.37]MDF1510608.1 hypothetical protein [Robertmurraya sp. DFI.2.37]
MEIEPKDYSYEIESLEKLITTIQSNVYFTITVIVALLALAVGIVGWALAVLVKSWVNKKINDELDIIDRRVEEQIKKNPQFYFASGNNIISSIEQEELLKLHGLDSANTTLRGFSIHTLKHFSKERLISFEVIDSEGNVLEKNLNINDDGVVTVTLKNSFQGQISWTAVWLKESYIN